MSARKLGRLAGLVFALAAFVGGVVVTTHATTSTVAVVEAKRLETTWG
jgi:hypothetical protein